MPTPSQYAVGVGALLRQKIAGITAQMSADLTAMVAKNSPAQATLQPVDCFMGKPRSASGPAIHISLSAVPNPQVALQELYTKDVRFDVMFLVPDIGDDLPANFEMAREVAADALTMLLDSYALRTPTIKTSATATAQAMSATRSDLLDLGFFALPDGTTVAEGFRILYTATFSLDRSTE